MRSNILVDRVNIGIFGRANAGKSTLMNLITSQETSIVDEKAGTTADVKQAVLEIHGFGPVKLFDTAGLDEETGLGKKKKFKALQTLKECDLALLVINPQEFDGGFSCENEVISLCKRYEKQIMVVFNVFAGKREGELGEIIAKCREKLDIGNLKTLVIDAHSAGAEKELLNFISANYIKREKKQELLPFIKPNSFVALNIPIDEETPSGRLLRPQNVVQDFLLRRRVPFACFRMLLPNARSKIQDVREEEKRNWLDFLECLQKGSNGLQLVITDSQAIDIVADWTPKEIAITTFSITMINYQSHGNLEKFVEGLKAIDKLESGDRIAIAEACNHNRTCDDIGTVQIPRRLKQKLGIELDIDFIFGREFPPAEKLGRYKLIVHCGGCMVDSQKISSRLAEHVMSRVPITNYGLLLSYLKGRDALKRVLEPWGM